MIIICKTILFFLLFISCSGSTSENTDMQLLDWDLQIGDKHYKVKSVPWENDINEGGAGRKDYDGFGTYKIIFYVPSEWKEESLAFYTDGMDDADETFLNGRLIGKTGRIPKNPNISLDDFRSSAREARVYPLPNLRFGKSNEIQIRIYDYAGLGGFAPKQIPIIGKYHSLQEREKNHRFLNDLPRTIGASFLLVFFISYFIQFFMLLPKVKLMEVLKSIYLPYRFYFRREQETQNEFSIETYISARYLLSALFCFFCILFLLTELTYKYLFIESEEFYFKIPTLGFVLGQFVLQLLMYPDVFGRGVSNEGNRFRYGLRLLFSFLTHPILTLMFFGYLIWLQPNEVWNEFTVKGMANLFFTVTLLFAGSAFNLLKAAYSENIGQNKETLKTEGFFRLFLLFSIVAGNILWFFSPSLYPFSFFIMILFLMIYMLVSLGFISKNKILLPIEPIKTFPIFTIVQKKYEISYEEAKIVEAVYNNLSRPEILKKLNIKEENLKKYLTSIYKKVFEYHPDVETTGRDKLQRLTMILHSKIDRSKPEG
jgi:hypothetical protein